MRTLNSNNLSYDKNGNLTAAPKDASTSMTLEYTWENKLCSAQIGSDEISIKYDPADIRVQKITNAQGTRKYIVDIVRDLPVIFLELLPTSMTVHSKSRKRISMKILTSIYIFPIDSTLGFVHQMMDLSVSKKLKILLEYIRNFYGS
jgi:hypothetical protein